MTTTTQSSQLLTSVLQSVADDRHVTVLDMGSALPETVAFFSGQRCTLHFADLFAELPFVAAEEGPDIRTQLAALLRFPAHTRFDICLFWDLFNYLDSDAIAALQSILQPHIHPGTRAYGFGVHNRRAGASHHQYGILAADTLQIRQRPAPLPGYAPLPQSQLQNLLSGFSFDRSVLLADSRLELLMSARRP
ncbi:hypothetical protein [Kineobactrum salinum]|uniref:Class I SAM-dependent methyltransferase n=1 Tax=Kineobactrum salinum TaxID=2708301 RepID=A0A6C0U596_9GAMM|nr:hypothetical protein [Kineobactrum salinum]QIB67291.1 hypothetical protein G3T16_19700 [Kineobactrum salinum]